MKSLLASVLAAGAVVVAAPVAHAHPKPPVPSPGHVIHLPRGYHWRYGGGILV
jgi:hypothetical protein